MNRPIIGITMDAIEDSGCYKLNFEYAAGVQRAGGIPLAIPYRIDPSAIPAILDAVDGVLFTGGDDLDPAAYGESWHPRASKIDPLRQRFEFALLEQVESRRLPALAICLGCQLLNVYRGGSLHQFIPDLAGKDEHRKQGDNPRRHEVTIEPQSSIGRTIGKARISANTYHKQAVRELGRGLVVTARAADGIIEGLEDPAFDLLAAVQWHPERLLDEPEHLAIFELLVGRAAAPTRGA